LAALDARALDVLLPLVDDDCIFSQQESRLDQFKAHLNLAMTDIELRFFDEILDFCIFLAPTGPEVLRADRLHFYAFESDDWHGAWGYSLRWTLVDSWALS